MSPWQEIYNCYTDYQWWSQNQYKPSVSFVHIDEDDTFESELFVPEEEEEEPSLQSFTTEVSRLGTYTELDRNVVSVTQEISKLYLILWQILFFLNREHSNIVFKRRRRFLLLSLQDILNHILSDIEIFMGQIAAAVAKNAKKKKKKNKGNLGQKMKAEHYWKFYIL